MGKQSGYSTPELKSWSRSFVGNKGQVLRDALAASYSGAVVSS